MDDREDGDAMNTWDQLGQIVWDVISCRTCLRSKTGICAAHWVEWETSTTKRSVDREALEAIAQNRKGRHE